jgi:hypothetical protein
MQDSTEMEALRRMAAAQASAMGQLGGAVKSAEQQASRARNLVKARAVAHSRLKPCTCGSIPHRQPCPVYWREYNAARRARQQSGAKQSEQEISNGQDATTEPGG